MNQKIVLVVSVVVGIIAFLLSMSYFGKRLKELEAERQRLYEGARKIEVVIARDTLPQGTVIQKTDLAKKSIYDSEARISGHAVLKQDAEMILGRKTLFRIEGSEVIFWSDIEGGGGTGAGLAPIIKPGLRAVSLSVGGASAVSSMVAPNDRVDVLGTFALPSQKIPGELEMVTLTVLQDVSVLATGQQLANQPVNRSRGGRSASYSTITVEVTPREAELLVFAQQMKGRLTLTLRNPSDVSYEKDLPSVNFERLESSLPELNMLRQREIRHKKGI